MAEIPSQSAMEGFWPAARHAAIQWAFGASWTGAVLYYFGWSNIVGYLDSFGIPFRLLNYSTTDFLVSSFRILALPTAGLAIAALMMNTISLAPRRKWRIPKHRYYRSFQIAVLLVACAAFLSWRNKLAIPGIGGGWQFAVFAATIWLFGMITAGHAKRASEPAWQVLIQRWLSIVVALLVSVFAVSLYGNQQGADLGQRFKNNPHELRSVLLYSKDKLPLMHELKIGLDGGYRYEYSGYGLIANSTEAIAVIDASDSSSKAAVILPLKDASIILAFGP